MTLRDTHKADVATILAGEDFSLPVRYLPAGDLGASRMVRAAEVTAEDRLEQSDEGQDVERTRVLVIARDDDNSGIEAPSVQDGDKFQFPASSLDWSTMTPGEWAELTVDEWAALAAADEEWVLIGIDRQDEYTSRLRLVRVDRRQVTQPDYRRS